MTLSLDIIIVNWNAGSRLSNCLQSIVETDKEGFVINRVVVVDNASSDKSYLDISGINLQVNVIHNSINRGFAAACNQGARESEADYILFLNPDTRLFSDSLAKPIRFMETPENERVGICGIKLLDENGSPTISCARFPTPEILFGKITGLSKLLPIFKEHLMAADEYIQSGFVDQVIGAFFLVRKKLYSELDGFDERFFVYYEEVDFSLRAKNAGYVSYLLTEVSAQHTGGACSVKAGSNRLFYNLRSRIIFGLKHYSLATNILLILTTLTIEPFSRSLWAIRQRSLPSIRETFTAYGKLIAYFMVRKQWA
ncbi:MAG: glycosyltransferase family 2 protein [Thermoleophilia bacterium]